MTDFITYNIARGNLLISDMNSTAVAPEMRLSNSVVQRQTINFQISSETLS